MFFQRKKIRKQAKSRWLHTQRPMRLKMHRRIANETLGGVLLFEPLEERKMLAGDIAFAESDPFTTGRFPSAVVASDLDGDGNLDLAVGVQSNGSVDVLFGNGDGTFQDAESTTGIGRGAEKIIDGDFDMDGDIDLVRNTLGDKIALFHNDGKGSFEDIDYFVASQRRFDLITLNTGDFDGDGDLDLAVGNAGDSSASYRGAGISVLINNGTSDRNEWLGLAEPVWYETGRSPRGIAVGDWDGDGDLDMASANSSPFCCGQTSDVSILLGNGDGTFSPETRIAVGDGPESIQPGDLDGDGDLDLVLGKSNFVERRVVPGGIISILLGNGDGTFSDVINQEVAPSDRATSPVIVEDFNGDGMLDVLANAATLNGPQIDLLILLGNGDATFEEPVVISGARATRAGDFDGDGDLDLVGTNFYSHQVEVLLNTTKSPVAPNPGDANKDGVFNQLDVVQVLQASKYLTGQPASFGEGDWNGDGVFDQLDIVAALASGTYLA